MCLSVISSNMQHTFHSKIRTQPVHIPTCFDGSACFGGPAYRTIETCRNVDLLYENFRIIKCMVHIAGNL